MPACFSGVYRILQTVADCVLSLRAHDSESFDVFGLSLFLRDNLSHLRGSQGEETQHTNLPTSLQDAAVG